MHGMILEQHPSLFSLTAADMLRLAQELKERAGHEEVERQKTSVRAAIEEGWDSAEAGRLHSPEEAREQLAVVKTRLKMNQGLT